MDEETIKFDILGVVVADLDAHWKLIVNTQKSQSYCSVLLPLVVYFSSEAVVGDGKLKDGILDIGVKVTLGKRVLKCHQGVLFGYYLEVGE